MSKQSHCGGSKEQWCKHLDISCDGTFYCKRANKIRYYTMRSDGTYGWFSKYKCDERELYSSEEPLFSKSEEIL